MKIELRIFKVDCDKKIAKSIVAGIKAFLKAKKWHYNTKNYSDKKLNEMIKENTHWGKVHVDSIIDELNEEKVTIAERQSRGEPHWDVIILGKKLNGGFAASSGIVNRSDLFHIIFTTSLGHDAEIKGFLLGLHEANHSVEKEHCNNQYCIFAEGDLEGIKLTKMVEFWKDAEKRNIIPFPLCKKHVRSFS